jgi:hypothetical protein
MKTVQRKSIPFYINILGLLFLGGITECQIVIGQNQRPSQKLDVRDFHEQALPLREIRNGLRKETTRTSFGHQRPAY